jgi:uncharacterized protein YdhG (YjbR/CyaY superfamily)
MARPGYATIDAYLAAQSPPARAVLRRLRAILKKALPGASEGISYQIPIFKLDGVMVLYFAGFSGHYSIYPATPGVIAALGEGAAAHLHSKATLRFSYQDPVPARLITRFAKLRAAEAAERRASRAAKKAPAKKQTAARKRAKKSAPAPRGRASGGGRRRRT